MLVNDQLKTVYTITEVHTVRCLSQNAKYKILEERNPLILPACFHEVRCKLFISTLAVSLRSLLRMYDCDNDFNIRKPHD